MLGAGLIRHLLVLLLLDYEGEKQEVINRTMNLLSKLTRQGRGAEEMCTKVGIEKTLHYFNESKYPGIFMNSLRIFHAICKLP